MKKKIAILIVTAALVSGIFSGCAGGRPEIVFNMNMVGKNDVFSINGEDCTKEEARLYLCNYQNLYGHEYGIDLWQHDFGDIPEEETLETYVKDVTLAELANIFCMNQLAKEQKITLTEEEQELVLQAAEEYYATLSKDELRYMGLDKGKLKEYYKKYAIARKFYQTLSEGVNEEVSDDEARVILMHQIFVKNEADARTIQQNLENGTDFDVLAGNYNEAETIEVQLARNVYPEEVEEAAFRLDNNQISGMIETEDGFYFIKCLNKYLEDMTEANKQNIILKRQKEQFENVFGKFIENSDFALNEKVWEDIKPDTSGIITTDSYFKVYNKYFRE